MTTAQKLQYLAKSSVRFLFGLGNACPSCGSTVSRVVDSKFVVTRLVRCGQCRLLFRTPTTTRDASRSFYQSEYSQGFTTSVPTESELELLKRQNFSGEKDYTPYIDVLRELNIKPGARIFDFGCSWGYGRWQLEKHGYKVTAFEISMNRGAYAAEKLGISTVTSIEQVTESFDVFFSAHVL